MHTYFLKYSIFLIFVMGLQTVQGQQTPSSYVEGDVIIKFKDSSDIATRQSINSGPGQITLQGVSKSVSLNLKQSFNNFSIQHYSSVSEQSTKDIIEQLQNHPVLSM